MYLEILIKISSFADALLQGFLMIIGTIGGWGLFLWLCGSNSKKDTDKKYIVFDYTEYKDPDEEEDEEDNDTDYLEEENSKEEEYDYFYPIDSISKDGTLIFFDTETTGLPKNYKAPVSNSKNWPRLVQLSWILTTVTGKVISKRDYIIDPEYEFDIPEAASKIHGITTERAEKEGFSIRTVLDEFSKDVKNANIIIGHNVDFDIKIIEAELYRLSKNDFLKDKKRRCTMHSSTNFCAIPLPGRKGYKSPQLQELYKKLFGSTFKGAHNSLNDVEATMKCYFELVKKRIIIQRKITPIIL